MFQFSIGDALHRLVYVEPHRGYLGEVSILYWRCAGGLSGRSDALQLPRFQFSNGDAGGALHDVHREGRRQFQFSIGDACAEV